MRKCNVPKSLINIIYTTAYWTFLQGVIPDQGISIWLFTKYLSVDVWFLPYADSKDLKYFFEMQPRVKSSGNVYEIKVHFLRFCKHFARIVVANILNLGLLTIDAKGEPYSACTGSIDPFI